MPIRRYTKMGTLPATRTPQINSGKQPPAGPMGASRYLRTQSADYAPSLPKFRDFLRYPSMVANRELAKSAPPGFQCTDGRPCARNRADPTRGRYMTNCAGAVPRGSPDPMRERLIATDAPAQGGVQRRLDSLADRFLEECADGCLFGRGQLF